MREFKIIIGYLTNNLLSDIRQKTGIADDVGQRQGLIMPVMRGTVIAITISLIERILRRLITKYPDSNLPDNQSVPTIGRLKSSQRYLGLDPTWWGWRELAVFWIIRHYFAHGMESINDLRSDCREYLHQFHQELKDGNIRGITKVNGVRQDVILEEYFSIENDELVLRSAIENRLRDICCYFLEEIEKKGLTLS